MALVVCALLQCCYAVNSSSTCTFSAATTYGGSGGVQWNDQTIAEAGVADYCTGVYPTTVSMWYSSSVKQITAVTIDYVNTGTATHGTTDYASAVECPVCTIPAFKLVSIEVNWYNGYVVFISLTVKDADTTCTCGVYNSGGTDASVTATGSQYIAWFAGYAGTVIDKFGGVVATPST